MNLKTVKKTLDVFRGTYVECMAQQTIDRKIYLAWDSRQIFVGNKLGVKVPYSGFSKAELVAIFNSTLQTEDTKELLKKVFDSAFEDFKNDITNIVDEKVEASVNELLKDAEDRITENVKSNIDGIVDTKLNDFEIAIDEKIETFKNDTNSNLRDLSTKIESNKIDIDSLKIENSETKNKIANLNTKITEIETKTEKIDTLESSLNDVKIKVNKIDELESNLNTLTASVNQNTTNISIATENIETLFGKVNKLEEIDTDRVLYKTGDQIDAIVSENPENLKPTFCLKASGNGEYKIGYIYYYNGSKVVSAGGGGTTPIIKETVDAGMSLIAAETNLEINAEPIDIPLTAKITNRDAIKGTASLIFNNGTPVDIDFSSSSTFIKSFSVPRDSVKSFSAVLSAVAADETETTKYTASTKYAYISVYQPWFFGNEGNLKKYTPNVSQVSTTVSPNQDIFLYTTKQVSITSSGFAVAADLEQNIIKEVNGVQASYYRYKFEAGDITSATWDLS